MASDDRQFMIVESDGHWTGATITGLGAAREYRDFLQSSAAHTYKSRGERLRLQRI